MEVADGRGWGERIDAALAELAQGCALHNNPHCTFVNVSLTKRLSGASCAVRCGNQTKTQGILVIMTTSTERSCWCFARRTIAVFLVAICLVYLFGGFEPTLVAGR